MDNAGPLKLVGNKLQAWFGKTYPKSQAFHGKHKLEDEFRWWHAYTEIQIATAVEVAKLGAGVGNLYYLCLVCAIKVLKTQSLSVESAS